MKYGIIKKFEDLTTSRTLASLDPKDWGDNICLTVDGWQDNYLHFKYGGFVLNFMTEDFIMRKVTLTRSTYRRIFIKRILIEFNLHSKKALIMGEWIKYFESLQSV